MKPLVAVFLLLATLGCGEGGQVQPETADALRARAEQGDAEAQVSLGVKYGNGDGVAEDNAEAARWFRLGGGPGGRRGAVHPRGHIPRGTRRAAGLRRSGALVPTGG